MAKVDQFYEAIEQQYATLRFVRDGGCENLLTALAAMNVTQRIEKEPALAYNDRRQKEYAAEVIRAVAYIIMEPLRSGTPFYWSEELVPTLIGLAPTVPGDWRLERDMLPAPAGYLRFARPLPLTIYDGRVQEDLVAITWVSASLVGGSDEICFTFHTSDRVREAGDPATVGPWKLGGTLDGLVEQGRQQMTRRDPATVGARWIEKLRYTAAAIAFMNTTIAAKQPTDVPRSTRRRLEQANWQNEPRVQVVQLRRRKPHPDGPATFREVDWKCRWTVHHHWRNQYYPSTDSYRRILIPDYIKGPDDAPLKPPSARLFAVTR